MASDKDTPGGKPSPSSSETADAKTSKTDKASASNQSGGQTADGTASSGKRPVTIDLKPEKVEAKTSGSATTDPKSAKSASAKSAEPSATRQTAAPSKETSTAQAVPPAGQKAKPDTSKDFDRSQNKSDEQNKTSPGESKPQNDRAGTKKTPQDAQAAGGSQAFSKPADERNSSGVVGLLAAAVFGGIVVLSGAYGLHVAGFLNMQSQSDGETQAALTQALARLSSVENQLTEVARSAADTNTQDRLDALDDQITALSGQITDGTGNDFAETIAALQAAVQSLETEVADAPPSSANIEPQALGDLDARIAAAEENTAKTGELQTSVSVLSQDLGDMATRLDNVEATAKAAQTAVSTSDVSLKTIADSQERINEAFSSHLAEFAALNTRETLADDRVREDMASLTERLEEVEATMGDATARELAARALSVSALKSAVDSGRPFETELAAVRAGLPETTDLSALQAHAKSGVTPVSALIAEFPNVARAMFSDFTQPERTGDVFESLVAGARSLVAIRGPGDETGTGPEAALRRMETAVAQGDLETGLAAYEALPEQARGTGADWAARARARVEIDELTDKASSDVLSSLARRCS